MKKYLTIFAVILFAASASAGNLSAGIFLGYPNALVLRMDMSEASAVDGYIGWDWAGLYLAGDFVIKKDLVLENITLKLYYGGGAFLTLHSIRTWEWAGTSYQWVSESTIHVGVRAKVGVSYFLPDMPIELFIEIGPGITFVPGFHITGIGGVGARYIF
ncbi:hypothetical protein KAU32_03535 [bacterium]|nr:hypothetical protein [bacterium]